jgi:hypothetical protein
MGAILLPRERGWHPRSRRGWGTPPPLAGDQGVVKLIVADHALVVCLIVLWNRKR